MDTNTFYGDFMVKLVWWLCGNFILLVFSIKTPDKLLNFHILWRQQNFYSDRGLPVESVCLFLES